MNELTEDEVHRIVAAYESPAITASLDAFGRLLLAANRERTTALESKAILIVGYGLAVLAFLVSREPTSSVVVGPWPPLAIRLASVCAALSLACAFLALRVRTHRWLSDRLWFETENDVMADPDALARCHVLAFHAANAHLHASNDAKADRVMAAQVLLIAAGLCLAVWIIMR